MSQYDFSNIDPDLTSGTALATLLNSWREAIKTHHAGAARPSYAVAGMVWVKTVSATAHEVYYYDGADDVLLYTVNPTANTVALVGSGITLDGTAAPLIVFKTAGVQKGYIGPSGSAMRIDASSGGTIELAYNGAAVGTVSSTGLAIGSGYTLTAAGNIVAGNGGSSKFVGLADDGQYMRLHGSNAINQGAGVILFGGTASPANTGRLMVGANTEVEWIANAIYPGADNTKTLGTGARRWSTVYAGTGTINTSDARTKQDLRVLAAHEIAAARQLAAEVGTYRFIAAVEAKGAAARQHVGLTVQRAIQIMEAHGLDPMAYGFICYDAWAARVIEHPEQSHEEETGLFDAQGRPALRTVIDAEAWTETIPAGETYGFRHDELLLFIARGLAAWQADLEARVAALEAA